MGFSVKKFRVSARVMRRADGSPTRVSIVPTKSMKRKGEKKVTEELTDKQKTKKPKPKPKRKVRAPRS